MTDELTKPDVMGKDPWESLSTPKHVDSLVEAAFGQSKAHNAVRKSRMEELGSTLEEPGKKEEFLRSAHYLTDDELAETKKNQVKQFMGTLGKIKATLGESGMAEAALAGRGARGWYRTATKTIFHLFPSPDDAFRFTALLAATSPRTPVDGNLKLALDIFAAWNKDGRPAKNPKEVQTWLKGLNEKWQAEGKTVTVKGQQGEDVQVPWGGNPSFGGHMGNVARALLYDGENWTHGFQLSGNKVNSFYQNLIGNLHASTNDTWMAHLAEIPQALFGNKTSYKAFTSVVRQTADTLNQ